MTAPPEFGAAIDVVRKMIETRKDQIIACDRMLELLKPEWDKFEARERHNIYVAREYADHTSGARTHRKEVDALEAVLSALPLAHPAAPQGEEGVYRWDRSELRCRIQNALQAELGGVYDCTRVWSAWSYGTMGEDDFTPVLDRMDDLIDTICYYLAQPALAPAAIASGREGAE